MKKAPYLQFSFRSSQFDRKLSSMKIAVLMKEQLQNHRELSACRIPPVRVLAHQLGVSKNTIQAAYDELKAQGVIESHGRQGLFVCSPDPAFSISPVVHGKAPAPQLVCPKIVASAESNLRDIPLSNVFLDPAILPIDKINECFRSVTRNSGDQASYDIQGYKPLREIIAKRLRQRGIEVGADHIMLTNGSQSALDIVSRSLQSKIIATENPAYYLGKALFDFNQVTSIGLPINPFEGISFDRWEKLIGEHRPKLLYLTTNYQNPTGYSYSSAELNKILEWSIQYDFGILEDDWGSDMLSFSEFRPSLRSLGGDNILYMNSFTKKLLPSLRVGYIAANAASISTLVAAKRMSSIALPLLVEKTLFEFIDRGYYDTHLKFIQSELDRRYQNCLNLLSELMPEDVKWTTPGGGPILWLELPMRFSVPAIIEKLKSQGVVASDSSTAFFGTPHLHGLRIGYAYLNKSSMRTALERLAVILNNLEPI